MELSHPDSRVYPFRPKTTSELFPGDFWQIHLTNGTFACGRMVAYVATTTDKGKRRTLFIAGLMDWSADILPSRDQIAGRKTIDQSMVAVKILNWNNSQILGWRSLDLDQITVRPGLLTAQGQPLESWGLDVMTLLAEKYFVHHDPIPTPRY